MAEAWVEAPIPVRVPVTLEPLLSPAGVVEPEPVPVFSSLPHALSVKASAPMDKTAAARPKRRDFTSIPSKVDLVIQVDSSALGADCGGLRFDAMPAS